MRKEGLPQAEGVQAAQVRAGLTLNPASTMDSQAGSRLQLKLNTGALTLLQWPCTLQLHCCQGVGLT